MVARNDVIWADLEPPHGRRPVVVLTRNVAIPVLSALTCAPVTTTIRGLRSEVEIGPEEGVAQASAVSCDSVLTVPLHAFDPEPVGRLSTSKRVELDQALRYALEIVY